MNPTPAGASVLLYWLPLGAGGHSVRWNGRLFEALVARREHRAAVDVYHCALEVRIGADRWVIEMAPAWVGGRTDHGVMVQGPVGLRWLGASVLFRYEIRRWRGGAIPDVAEAVASPLVIDSDAVRAGRLLDLVPRVPALTWGRDERHTGDMWNSNSLVAWLLTRSEHDVAGVRPPAGGGAPGWHAGLTIAAGQ